MHPVISAPFIAPVAKIPAPKVFAWPGSGSSKVQSSTVRPAESSAEMPIATWSPRGELLEQVPVRAGQAGERVGGGENLTSGTDSLMPRIVTESHPCIVMSPGRTRPGLPRACKTTPLWQACRVMPSSSGPRISGAGSV